MTDKANPRFIVSSLSKEKWAGKLLYEDLYCQRGEMENRIKEQQLGLFADQGRHVCQLRPQDASQSDAAVAGEPRLRADRAASEVGTARNRVGTRSGLDPTLKAVEDWSVGESERATGVFRDLEALPEERALRGGALPSTSGQGHSDWGHRVGRLKHRATATSAVEGKTRQRGESAGF